MRRGPGNRHAPGPGVASAGRRPSWTKLPGSATTKRGSRARSPTPRSRSRKRSTRRSRASPTGWPCASFSMRGSRSPALTYRQLQDADAALRDRALPARRAQGRPGRAHAAELPAVRGRLLRGDADRRHPRQHEPHVRVAGDAGAVRGLGLRDGGAPRPVLPAPARDPRGHPGPPGDRRGRGREPALVRARSSSTSRSGARASASGSPPRRTPTGSATSSDATRRRRPGPT